MVAVRLTEVMPVLVDPGVSGVRTIEVMAVGVLTALLAVREECWARAVVAKGMVRATAIASAGLKDSPHVEHWDITLLPRGRGRTKDVGRVKWGVPTAPVCPAMVGGGQIESQQKTGMERADSMCWRRRTRVRWGRDNRARGEAWVTGVIG